MPDLHVVVLAAGKGTRMRSARHKVLHRISGRRLLDYVLGSARALGPQSITVVVGHLADQVRQAYAGVSDLRFVAQEPQLGTGHALLQAEPALQGADGTLLLLSGDVPLLSVETLRQLVERHQTDRAAATVVTAVVDRPYGYGRIVRSAGRIVRIVEERDASAAERQNQGDQRRGLRVRHRAAVRGPARDRVAERAGRVLPARSRGHLPAAPEGRVHGDGARCRSDPGDQQPRASWRRWQGP